MIGQRHQQRGLANNTQPDPAQRISDLVSQEMRRVPRGEPLPLFKEFVSPYLVTDARVEQFLKIHHAEVALPQRSSFSSALSEKQFTEFLE